MGIIEKQLGRKIAFRILILIQFGFIILSFLYMIFIREGVIEYAAEVLDIDTMGRIKIYNAIKKYYVISPDYIGRGIGWINRNLQEILGRPDATEGLHCHILELYIELGFWGFICFFGYQLVGQCTFLYKQFGIKIARLYSVMYMYCWLTYLTDNTVFYRGINAAVRMIVIACIVLEHERSNRLWTQIIEK